MGIGVCDRDRLKSNYHNSSGAQTGQLIGLGVY